MFTVFVTGAGGGVGQGVLKCLRRIEDIELRTIAADMSPLATGLYYADLAQLVPAASSPDYVDTLIELFRRHAVDLYIPGTDVELEVAALARERIRDACGTDTVISPVDAVRVADDKYLTARFLEKHGLPFPKTWLPAEVDVASLRFPVIVKPRVGARSIGVDRVYDAESLAVRLQKGDNPVIQEYLDAENEEFTCTVVRYQGEFSPVVALRRVLRAGDTYRAEPVEDHEVFEFVRQVASLLEVDGSCNFQLRKVGDEIRLFEINARFSGTTPFCAALGVNPVEFYLKRRLGLPCDMRVRYDAIVLRSWSETVVPKSTIATLEREGVAAPTGLQRGVL